MARLRFTAGIPDIDVWKTHGITSKDNYVLLEYDDASRDRIRKILRKVASKNDENFLAGKDPVPLDVNIDIIYGHRTLKANALMWSLYTVMAEVLDKENKRVEKITPEELYEKDMESCAPRHTVFCEEKSLFFFQMVLEKERGHVKNVEKVDNGFYALEVWQTSSYWDTKRMGEHIERLMNELEDMGVTTENNGDVKKIFDDFEKWKAKEAKG